MNNSASSRLLIHAMNISFGVGIIQLIVKVTAAFISHSAAVFSDAAESVVHVLAVGFASYSLRLAEKPADDEHHYGHDKITFLSAGFEGAMIITAAAFIVYEAVHGMTSGNRVESIGVAIGLTAATVVMNLLLGLHLLRVAKREGSLILEANGHHTLTDVWTSLGTLAGLGLTALTHWHYWDPICALVVAVNILYSGWKLVSRSLHGLMDGADPALDRQLKDILDRETAARGASWHALRHRHAGSQFWVEFHLLFDDETPLIEAHDTATAIEQALMAAIPEKVEITSHLEPRHAHDAVHGASA